MTTLEHLNPADLLTDRNVRSDLHLTPAFIGSVKANGIIVPIVAIRDADGVRVRAGHRRTAAAIQAGLTQVPVVIIDDTPSDDGTRIVEQIVENHHRTGLTDLDTITAVEQLTAFGVPAGAITRRTRLPKATVTAAVTIAASEPHWVGWSLHRLETRMYSCRRTPPRASRPRVVTALKRRPLRCGWSGPCAPS